MRIGNGEIAMDQLGFLVMLLPAALMAVFGWLIRFRRIYGLISGYNTMSQEKRRNVDIERLGALFGNCLFIMAGIMAAGALLLKLGQGLVGFIVLALLAPVIIYLVVAGQRISGSTRTASGNARTTGALKRPGSKALVALIAVSALVLIGFVAFLIFRLVEPATVSFDGNVLSMTGLYSQQVAVGDMSQVALLDTLPTVLRRTNGSALGDQLAGHFTLEGVGPAMLYLNKGQPPFISIETAKGRIYLNAATPQDSRTLYERIQAAKAKK